MYFFIRTVLFYLRRGKRMLRIVKFLKKSYVEFWCCQNVGLNPGLAGRGHNCFVLRMGCKAVGPVCCVMHVKEPRPLIVKEKGLAPVFMDSRLEHPAGWICACYKSSVLLLLLLLYETWFYSKYVPTSIFGGSRHKVMLAHCY